MKKTFENCLNILTVPSRHWTKFLIEKVVKSHKDASDHQQRQEKNGKEAFCTLLARKLFSKAAGISTDPSPDHKIE